MNNDYAEIPVTKGEDEEFDRLAETKRADQIDPPKTEDLRGCAIDCGHSEIQHEAFDRGRRNEGEGEFAEDSSLREAWLSGRSVGHLDERPHGRESAGEFQTFGSVKPNVITRYFTFGQEHFHQLGDEILDRDSVVRITDENPRERMVELFATRWSSEYVDLSELTLKFYPRGIFDLNSRTWLQNPSVATAEAPSRPLTYDDIQHIELVDVRREEGREGHLLKVGYDPATKIAVGVFAKGKTYGYRNVPPGDAKAVLETAGLAEVSTGALFNRLIRPIKTFNLIEIPILARAERNDALAPEDPFAGVKDFIANTEAAMEFLPEGAPIPFDAALNGLSFGEVQEGSDGKVN